MFDIHVEKNERFRTVFAMGSDGPKPLTTVINCKSIYLAQESIGIDIEVTEAFKRTNTISVNGVEFVKPKEGYWTGILSKDYAHAEGVHSDATPEQRAAYQDMFNHITHCSECGWMFDDRNVSHWNFCPGCGAKMKEATDDVM